VGPPADRRLHALGGRPALRTAYPSGSVRAPTIPTKRRRQRPPSQRRRPRCDDPRRSFAVAPSRSGMLTTGACPVSLGQQRST
jgi:hypothetical protein